MSNRSGSPYSTPRDANHVPFLVAASTADGITPVVLEADPTTHALVTSGSGGGSGTQYTQGGATVANPTGTAGIYFDGSGNPKAITPSQPMPSNLTDGTNVANVVAGDTGFNGVAVAVATKTYSFSTSTPGAQTILANTPTEGFATVEIVYTSVGAGLGITGGQFSATSGGTYVSSANFASGTSGFSGALGTTVNTIYTSPVKGNYFQIAVSALTSGTFAGTVTLRAAPPQSSGVQASQTGTWTVGSNSATGSAVPANAFYMGVKATSGNLAGLGVPSQTLNSALSAGEGLTVALAGQLDDTSPTTITENNFGNLRMDSARQLRVNNQLAPDATILNSYSARITTNTTTTPTASTAYISSITVCVETAGTTSTLDIRDKSATPLYLVRSLSTASLLTNGEITYNFQTPIKMTSGIDVITAGAAAAAVNVFVNYYQ